MRSGLPEKKTQVIATTVHDAIPYIFHQKNKDFWVYKNELRITDKMSQAIIVVSQKSKDDLLEFTDIKADKIHVVYNGINHDFFYPNEIKKINEIFTIRYSGGLGGRKNIETLLYAARILEDRHIEFKMEISGMNPEKIGLTELMDELKLKNVSFMGFVPDDKLREFLSEADLFVFPSLYEGLWVSTC